MKRAALFLSSALFMACLDPLVGGACLDGYAMRSGQCVAVDDDDAAPPRDGAVDASTPPDGAAQPDSGQPDGPMAPDGETTPDAGPLPDGGPVADNGPQPDTGSQPDTGPLADSGPLPDGTTLPDSGPLPDTGWLPDVAPGTDSGVSLDGGTLPDGGPSVDPDGGPAGDSDGGASDGGTFECAPPLFNCGGLCVDRLRDRLNCGGCGRLCTAGRVCSAGECVSACASPTVFCAGRCADLSTDPDHCGRCGNTCASGICNGGVCRTARPGHLVLVGHDYVTTRTEQNRIVGNAVFLSGRSPVRVLSYGPFTRTVSVGHVDDAIQQVAGGRPWTRSVLEDLSLVGSMLNIDRTDVFLVYAEPLAPPGEIERLASLAGEALAGFVRAGGVVIVLDGGGTNRGTFPIVNATGLMSVGSRAEVTGAVVQLRAPADALVAGMPESYRAELTTVNFEVLDDTPTVLGGPGGAVVLHRAVLPTSR